MAVFSVSVWKPVLGRTADLLADMARAKVIIEANGGICSAWQPTAGGIPGTLSFVIAYDGPGSYGRTTDALNASPEWQAFFTEAMANPSATNESNFILMDLDATEGLPTTASRVLVANAFESLPGRAADHVRAHYQARAHLTRLGAQVRIVQSTGTLPGAIGILSGFEDFTHYGEFGEKLAVDEQWASFMTGLGADPPGRQVDSQVSAQIDLPS